MGARSKRSSRSRRAPRPGKSARDLVRLEGSDAAEGQASSAPAGVNIAADAAAESVASTHEARPSGAPTAQSSSDGEPESLGAADLKAATREHSPVNSRGLEIERRASSIPPALVHAVFEVSPELPKTVRKSAHETPPLPPAVTLRSRRPPLRVSKPPAPPRRSSRPPSAEHEEDGVEPRFSLLSSAAVPVLSAPPTDVAAPPARPAHRSGQWFAVAAAALLVVFAGVVLGLRTRAAGAPEARPSPAAAEPAPPLLPAAAPLATLELPKEPPGFSGPALESTEEAAEVPRAQPSLTSLSPASSSVAPVLPAIDTAAATPARSPAAPSGSASEEALPELPGFDAAAAGSAISAAFRRAAACRSPGDPSGAVTATLTYAPSGRVTSALVSGPFAGTSIGSCIAGHLRGARVARFAGDYTTVKRSIVLK